MFLILNFQQFDIVIEGVKGGQPADLSEMPPPPMELQSASTSAPPEAPRESEEHQSSEAPPEPQPRPPIISEGVE